VKFLIPILAAAGLLALRHPRTAPSYLALGDSYTIGESVDSSLRYPVQAMRLLFPDARPSIIATTGWTTANLLDAISAIKPDTNYEAVSLLIGVNNQYQGRSQEEYSLQFETLLKAAIRLAGKRPNRVLVLSIPDYSVTPFARSRNTTLIAAEIDSFNAINNRIASACRVNYLDITAESRKALTDSSLIAGDGLHFSGKEYAIWARMMEPWLLTTLSQR